MRPFNLEEAKQGKLVCTRDGREARIICFNRVDTKGYNIVALVKDEVIEKEIMYCYNYKGEYYNSKSDDADLFMKPEKRQGWINIYINSIAKYVDNNIFPTKHDAECSASGKLDKLVTTTKIEWEE